MENKVEMISLKCLECGQETPVAANSVYLTVAGLNYFCHDKDCEDIFSAKL